MVAWWSHMGQPQIVADLMGHGMDHQFRQQDLRRVGLSEKGRLPADHADRAPDLGHSAEGQGVRCREQPLAPNDEEVQ